MGSFRKRLLVLIIGLVVVTQTVTLAAVLASTAHTVRTRAAEQLRSAGSFATQLIQFRAGQLANGVGVLAADFGFREAVASGDGPTIISAATNNAGRIGADLVLVVDTRGKVLAATGAPGAQYDLPLKRLLSDGGGQRDEPVFAVLGGQPYQFFVAPVRTPDTIAWVAMGFVVNGQLAKKMRDLVGADVTLIAHGADGSPQIASTVSDRERMSALSRWTPDDHTTSDTEVIRTNTTEYLSYGRRVLGRGDPVDIIVQKSMRDVLAPYRDVRDALLLIDGLGLALAAVIGTLMGRSATRPIGQLVEAAERIQAGEYGTVVEATGGEEFRSLSAAFNRMQQNVAEREAHITHQAFHDSVTGLPNRAFAQMSLEEMLAAGTSQSATVMLIDVRNVREIIASFGHHVGDEVLRESARRLRMNAKPDDLVSRIGESQFLVIAQECPAQRAALYADQLAQVIGTGFHVADMSLELHVAAAVCVYPEHGATADELLRRVQITNDDAEESRNRVTMYRPGGDEAYRRRLQLVTDLRTAIDQDGLTLVYQPKVEMVSRCVRSLEALVRWNHPQLGPISPGEFVPLAERTGGSRRLTSWVLNAAVRQLGQWRAMGLNIEVAVNLSAPDLLDPELGDEILGLLRASRVDTSALVLEITESAVMRDPHSAARNMQLLRIAGLRFAMDDFGTGHSSLSQLSLLPLDELKIDRSFVSRAHAEGDAKTIIASTIELAHRLGLKVVAEGVEETEAWNLLRSLGCDYAQGYLISRPLPATDVPSFVGTANQVLASADSTMIQMRALQQLTAKSGR